MANSAIKERFPLSSTTLRTTIGNSEAEAAFAWIKSAAIHNAFAYSLDRSLEKYEGLSLKQWETALKCANDADFAAAMDKKAVNSQKRYYRTNKANKPEPDTSATDTPSPDNMMQNDRTIKLNANQTDYLRDMVKEDGNFGAFKATFNVQRERLKGKQLFDACDYLGIDIKKEIDHYNAQKISQFSAIGKPDNSGVGVDWERVRKIARDEVERRAQPIYKTKIVLDQGGTKTDVKIDGIQHPKFDLLFAALNTVDYSGSYLNVILCGPTGTGKSFAARQIAKALELTFYLQVQALENYDLIGYEKINGEMKETPFLWAFRDGGIILLDELDSYDPKAVTALNSAIANGELLAPDGTIIPRHKECRVIGATNTSGLGATGDYTSREKLDLATLSRFTVQIDWHVNEEMEQTLAAKHGGQQGVEWAQECSKARAAFTRLDLPALVDQRTIEAGIGLLKQGLDLDTVRALTYLSRLDADQVIAVKEIVKG